MIGNSQHQQAPSANWVPFAAVGAAVLMAIFVFAILDSGEDEERGRAVELSAVWAPQRPMTIIWEAGDQGDEIRTLRSWKEVIIVSPGTRVRMSVIQEESGGPLACSIYVRQENGSFITGDQAQVTGTKECFVEHVVE